MKHYFMYDKDKQRNVKKFRIIILCVVIAILVIVGGTIMVQKYSVIKQAVQAAENDQKSNSEEESVDEATNSTTSTITTEESETKESDSEVESVAFVEKYLDQQMKGQRPDGADGKKVVYLTFDDGPSETVTPKILDVLKAESVHATFFVVGKTVDESETNKNLVKRELAEGNAIGNHTYSHNYNYLYPNGHINLDNCMADIEKTNQSLKNILGQDFSTRAIRFPGGHMTWRSKDPSGMDSMDKLLAEKDYHQIDWNSLSKDAEGAPKKAQQLKEAVIETIAGREKAILLMHDTYGKEETAKALPEVIKYLKEQGYEFKIVK